MDDCPAERSGGPARHAYTGLGRTRDTVESPAQHPRPVRPHLWRCAPLFGGRRMGNRMSATPTPESMVGRGGANTPENRCHTTPPLTGGGRGWWGVHHLFGVGWGNDLVPMPPFHGGQETGEHTYAFALCAGYSNGAKQCPLEILCFSVGGICEIQKRPVFLFRANETNSASVEPPTIKKKKTCSFVWPAKLSCSLSTEPMPDSRLSLRLNFSPSSCSPHWRFTSRATATVPNRKQSSAVKKSLFQFKTIRFSSFFVRLA